MEEQVEMVSTSMMLLHSLVILGMLCKDQPKHSVRLIGSGATHLQYAKVRMQPFIDLELSWKTEVEKSTEGGGTLSRQNDASFTKEDI